MHQLVAIESALLMLLASVSSTQTQERAGRPRVFEVSSEALENNAQLSLLIAEIREQADAFVFLSGGASKMSEDHQRQLLAMFEALAGKMARLAARWMAAGFVHGVLNQDPGGSKAPKIRILHKGKLLPPKDGTAVLVEVENHTHLHKVLKAVRKVKGVTEIARRDSGGPAEVVVG